RPLPFQVTIMTDDAIQKAVDAMVADVNALMAKRAEVAKAATAITNAPLRLRKPQWILTMNLTVGDGAGNAARHIDPSALTPRRWRGARPSLRRCISRFMALAAPGGR